MPMPITYPLKRIQRLLSGDRRYVKPKFLIPYGRHTYGPQPEIIGHELMAIDDLARGSRVGNFCSIADGFRFAYLPGHDMEAVSTYPFEAFCKEWDSPTFKCRKGESVLEKEPAIPIIIENDVWIGMNVTIRHNVTVGNGAVIAMDSLVTKDIPPYAVVGGNPAKIIKYRFDNKQIEELQKIAWWNWTDERINKMLPIMTAHDIDKFIKIAKDENTQ